MAWIIAKCIEGNKTKEVQELLQPYSFLERRRIISTKHKRTSVLYMAVKRRDLTLVNYLLDGCGANPNDTGYENGLDCPCLWKAADLNDLKIAESLLQHGADINGVNRLGATSLSSACHYGNLIMVDYLCNHKANVNSADLEGSTCLMISVIANPEICRYLLSKGANVDAVNNRGESALILAINSKSHECVSYLLDAGADPTIKNNQGENSLFMAAKDTTGTIRKYFKSRNHDLSHYFSLFTAIESCKYTIDRFESVPYTRLKALMKLWDYELNIPMCETTFSSLSISELNPIKHLLNPKDAKAMIFLESNLGLKNLFTMKLLKIAISKVENVDDCVTLFKYFIDLIDLSDNDLFFQMSENIFDLVKQFYSHKLHEFFDEEDVRENAILKHLVTHLEQAKTRLKVMGHSARFAKVKYIKVYFDLVLHLIGTIEFVYPHKLVRLQKYICQIVKLDLRCGRNTTLLHFSMEHHFRWTTIKILLTCGADVNSTDDFGNTPAHLALSISKYCSKQVIGCFLEYGLILTGITHEIDCLLCLLKKKNLLDKPFCCSSLKCMAAKAVVKYCLTVDLTSPEIIHNLISSHFEVV